MNIAQRQISALALTFIAWLALSPMAWGKVTHQQVGSFPLSESSEFNFLAVDNSAGPSSGDLYISETDNETFQGRVYQADSSGAPTGIELKGSETPAGSFGFINFSTFVRASGPAVDGSGGANAGSIYVPDVTNGVVDLFDEAGNYVCQITGSALLSASECAGATGSQTPSGGLEPLGVAVNPLDGTVAVGNRGGVIYEFNEAGEYEAQIADPHVVRPGSLAFDSTGHLYVVNTAGGTGEAVKLSPGGSFEYVVAPNAFGIGVDLNNDHAYFGGLGGSGVEEFDSAGDLVSVFDEDGARSVDVNKATGLVYLTLPSGGGQIWSGDIFAPTVVTGPASQVSETTATLSGHIEPEIPEGGTPVTACEFEYGETESYGQIVPCSPPAPYSSATDVTAGPAGLLPGKIYHYRLAAKNAATKAFGGDMLFKTLGPAAISGERAIARTRSATVSALINPFGYETTCEVEYVDEASFDASGFAGAATVPCEETLAGGFEPQTAKATLGGLTIGAIYHFRFVATNQAGTTTGEDATFSTFSIESFSIEPLDEEGQPFTEAGGHPYAMRVGITFSITEPVSDRNPGGAPANLRSVKVQLPPGLIGSPAAVPTCKPYEMKFVQCAPDAQLGQADVFSPRGNHESGPVYNLLPPEGVAAELGIRFNKVGTVRVDAGVRTGSDYGINADTVSITADEAVQQFEMTLWGVPAEESHNSFRQCRLSTATGCPSGAPLVPFLTNPTSCTGPLSSILSVDTWQDPGNFVSRAAQMPAITRCDGLDFKPTIAARPEVHESDSPTGLNVDLRVPQNENPVGRAEANLKDATVDLPAGLAVNPSGATGLAACSPAQIELHGPHAATCPDAAKIGTVEVDTPLLDHPLPGAVYVATPHANPFGSLLAIYVAIHDPVSGVVVKLAGEVKADPQTGQLSTTFRENPQVPFEDFKLNFFGGPQAALTTPQTCGEYTTTAELRPWTTPEGKDVHWPDSFQIGSGPGGSRCANTPGEAPHSPSFSAGAVTPLAGSFSPFLLNLSREDGSQRLAAIDTQLPPGLVGRLAGIAQCSDAALAGAAGKSGAEELASPSCPVASEVGGVGVGVGSGSQPYQTTGKAYLTGPYRGAPVGLAIVTPAVAGPFDLGNVVVRAALYIDRETARITARSDALPTILQGIPLDLRSVALRVDRPRFTLNPTNCEPMSITGTAFSVLGPRAPLSDRFQVGGCRELAFHPKLGIRLFGPTKRSGHPRLRATLIAERGEANIARTAVTLPASEFLDQAHIKTVCTRVQFDADSCPRGSIYGRAKARSPLLDYPLQGPVYLRSNGGERVLPDLVAALRGPAYQPIEIDLVGFIDSKEGGLRTRFEAVPDAPVSKFELSMQGGRKGLLVNSTNLCGAANRAAVKMRGQNGATHNFSLVVKNDCARRGKAQTRR